MNKKASLQLSINTIVLLVLALVLVGLVIGAFTGMFNQGREKLLNSIYTIDIGVEATSSNPIAGADAIRFSRWRDQLVVLSFYNKGYTQCEESASVVFYCPQGDFIRGQESIGISVPMNEAKNLGVIVNIGRVTPANYICTLKVRCGEQEIVAAEQHTVFKVT